MIERSARTHPLWTVYEHVAMFIGLGSLAVICLTWLPFAMILHPLLPGRKVSNGWANLETLWMGIGDSLYGFRQKPQPP